MEALDECLIEMPRPQSEFRLGQTPVQCTRDTNSRCAVNVLRFEEPIAYQGGVLVEQKIRFVQYQYTDWINQTSSTGPNPSPKRNPTSIMHTAPLPQITSSFRVQLQQGRRQPMIGLLPDDEVVEVDTLLALLLDLADDRAEVLNVLEHPWHQHLVGWKVG